MNLHHDFGTNTRANIFSTTFSWLTSYRTDPDLAERLVTPKLD